MTGWNETPKQLVKLDCGHEVEKSRNPSRFRGKTLCEACVTAIKVGTKLDCGHPKPKNGNYFVLGSEIVCSACAIKNWG